MRKKVCLLVVLTAGALLVAGAERAAASCNLIPAARSRFPSVLGGVASPIAAPNDSVEIRINPTCDNSPGFTTSGNTVTIDFEPPTGIDTLSVSAGIVGGQDCTLAGGTRCTRLTFTLPSTTGYLPDGLAGPARIFVRDSFNAVVAQIGELFLPTTGCNRRNEQVFRQFTVLPPLNIFADVISGGYDTLATVDGSGSLLIPFDYWNGGASSVLAETPGASMAILLKGAASIPAQSASDPQTISQVLAAQSKPSRFVRSFTPNGRPLPPLLRLTSSGELFGTSDAEKSVLRVQRSDGTTNFFDLTDRLEAGRGPVHIVLDTATRGDPVPIVSLRASSDSVAFARDESREGADLNFDSDQNDFVAQVVEPSTGVTQLTHRAVTKLTEGGLKTPAVVAKDNLVAFLESESGQGVNYNGDSDFDDSVLRVYASNGANLTSGIDVDADPTPLLDHRSAAISGDRVFFRSPGGAIDLFFDDVGGVDGLSSASDVKVSPDGNFVYVAGEGEDEVAVFSRSLGTGELSFVTATSVPFSNPMVLVVSPDNGHLYTWSRENPEGDGGNGVTVFSRDLGLGTLTFVESHNEFGTTGGFGNLTISPDGANLYVVAGSSGPETGDDAMAVYARNSVTGSLTFLESHNVANGDDIVVSPDGEDVYACADAGIFHFSRNPSDGRLTAIDSAVVANSLHRNITISPDGRHVYITFSNYVEDVGDIAIFERLATGSLVLRGYARAPQDVSPEGAGIATAIVLSPSGSRLYAANATVTEFQRDVVSGSLEAIAAVEEPGGYRLAMSPDGLNLYSADFPTDRLAAFRTDIRLGVFDTETATLRPLGPFVTRVATASERALFLTSEELTNGDLNGDFDFADDGVQLLDSTDSIDIVTSLNIAGRRVALSDELIAVTVPEGSEHDHDRNNDHDVDDNVLAVLEVGASPPMRNAGVAADTIATTGSTVVFARPEWSEPPNAPDCSPTSPPGGCDLNADGDALDRVLHTYRVSGGHGTLVNYGREVGVGPFGGFGGLFNPDYPDRPDIIVAGSLALFLTDEAAQGGEDLNGDGLFDTQGVLQVVDLDAEANEVINTGLAALPCQLSGCEPGVPFRVDPARRTVSFVVWEALQGEDLDGNFSILDFVLSTFNVNSGASQKFHLTEFSSPRTVLGGLPREFLDGEIIFREVAENTVGADLNGDGSITSAKAVVLEGDFDDDGVFDDNDTCLAEPNADEIDADTDGLGDSACDDDSAACPPTPLPGCLQTTVSGKASLKIDDKTGGEHDRLKWQWRSGDTTTLDDIGDPANGVAHYSLCLYDGSANPQPLSKVAILPAQSCGVPPAPCWKAAGKNGFKYKDKDALIKGIESISLRAGASGKAKVGVKGKGSFLELPALPLTLPSVRVQLVVHEGSRQQCWEAIYSTASQNEPGQFSAKGD